MKKELEIALRKLRNASARLREGAGAIHDTLDKDGVIQRFEFTFELVWKSLKIMMEHLGKGAECRSPRDCFKAAFRIGLIEDEPVWLQMLDDRNRTSHLYDEAECEKILKHVQEVYLPAIEKTLALLEQKAKA